MQTLFDINTSAELSIEEFYGSPIYTIDNFYKYPHEVINFINSHTPELWKRWDTPSFNGTKFIDSRHSFDDDRFAIVSNYLKNICRQEITQPSKIVTNKIQFIDYEFNDYFNNYWGPHQDLGYNGIVYLNDFTYPGTNLYEEIEHDNWTGPEHYAPWRPKSKYKIIKTIESRFNRLVLFDGKKFPHGMAITDDTFFNSITRFNQVVFFKDCF
jgi:hypothetical protein